MTDTVHTRTPNFLVIGAMKAATTTVYDVISRSPDASLPKIKEPGILTDYGDVESARAAYSRHFANSQKCKVVGEATTYYTMQPLFPNVSQFAKDVCGSQLKLIYISRDPVSRIISHVKHDYMVGRLSDTDLTQDVFFKERYLSIGRYCEQLEPWLQIFGREQFLFITFENLVSNSQRFSDEVYSFLDISPPSSGIESVHSNSNSQLRAPRGGAIGQLVRSSRAFRRAKELLPTRIKSAISPIVTKAKSEADFTADQDTKERLYDYYRVKNRDFESLISPNPAIRAVKE